MGMVGNITGEMIMYITNEQQKSMSEEAYREYNNIRYERSPRAFFIRGCDILFILERDSDTDAIVAEAVRIVDARKTN